VEPVIWSEKFSVGVEEMDQQHQQLIKLLNLLISAQGRLHVHSEEVSDALTEMTRYAQIHFKAEEKLMEAYAYPGLEDQKMQHRIFRKKTVDLCTATIHGVEVVPEVILLYLADWWVNHILKEDKSYRSFLNKKGVT
jgi:hemerythrin